MSRNDNRPTSANSDRSRGSSTQIGSESPLSRFASDSHLAGLWQSGITEVPGTPMSQMSIASGRGGMAGWMFTTESRRRSQIYPANGSNHSNSSSVLSIVPEGGQPPTPASRGHRRPPQSQSQSRPHTPSPRTPSPRTPSPRTPPPHTPAPQITSPRAQDLNYSSPLRNSSRRPYPRSNSPNTPPVPNSQAAQALVTARASLSNIQPPPSLSPAPRQTIRPAGYPRPTLATGSRRHAQRVQGGVQGQQQPPGHRHRVISWFRQPHWPRAWQRQR